MFLLSTYYKGKIDPNYSIRQKSSFVNKIKVNKICINFADIIKRERLSGERI